MINQFQLPNILEQEIPELHTVLFPQGRTGTAYQSIQAFLDYTNKKVTDHNYKAAKQCFFLADKVYQTGNQAVKNAIENIFIFSFSALFNQAGNDKRLILGMVPGNLYTIYIQQVLHKGC